MSPPAWASDPRGLPAPQANPTRQVSCAPRGPRSCQTLSGRQQKKVLDFLGQKKHLPGTGSLGTRRSRCRKEKGVRVKLQPVSPSPTV